MATEQSTILETPSGSLAKWTSWLAALVGLWAAASPFVLSGSFGTGIAIWSTLASGIAFVLAGYAGYFTHARA